MGDTIAVLLFIIIMQLQQLLTMALGGHSGGLRTKLEKQKKEGMATLPVFIAPENLKPFIPNELIDGLSNTIKYKRNGKIFEGFNAELLTDICKRKPL